MELPCVTCGSLSSLYKIEEYPQSALKFGPKIEPRCRAHGGLIRLFTNVDMRAAVGGERQACANIAIAIDSGRGNEKEIAKAIMERNDNMCIEVVS